MARRQEQGSKALGEIILAAGEEIVAEAGLKGLSAREIARRIGYSPGTIYNVFDNLDEVVLRIEAGVLDRLDTELGATAPAGRPRDDLVRLGRAYLAFTHDNARLWSMLFEHTLPDGAEIPDWYRMRLDRLLARVETAIAPLFAHGDQARIGEAARVLWAGVHGIASLSVADKLTIITRVPARDMIDNLITNYVAGLATSQDV